jgi:hypothetical protein
MHDRDEEYPSEAYAENGVLWWELETWPGKKQRFGGERKMAAWLAFELDTGDIFTMRQVREALGNDAVPNSQEHLNRRLRALREDGWMLTTNQHDKSLGSGKYRLDAKGWHPGLGPRPRSETISRNMERAVFERDGYRCVICGVGRGEPYPGQPETVASITVGHRQARAHQGSAKDMDNLETQCALHNETVREEFLPKSLDAVLEDLSRLRRRDELEKLETWLSQGYRSRDRLDRVYDEIRTLSPRDQDAVHKQVRRRLGR